jgi:hypothetical protein
MLIAGKCTGLSHKCLRDKAEKIDPLCFQWSGLAIEMP